MLGCGNTSLPSPRCAPGKKIRRLTEEETSERMRHFTGIVDQQLVLTKNVFAGMDKPSRPYCYNFSRGNCTRDIFCPYRHYRLDKTLICRHWMRGLCRKGDDCEASHEYDIKNMPVCYFYQKYGQCSNNDCPFLHSTVDPYTKECPYFTRGFCTSGTNCKFRHAKKEICANYYQGFCPYGPNCHYGHPKYELPVTVINFDATGGNLGNVSNPANKGNVVCHACNEPGHKSTACPLVQKYKEKARLEGNAELANLPPGKRPLELVTCFKCRERGHYANKCPLSMTEVQKMFAAQQQESKRDDPTKNAVISEIKRV